jgi:hypothetical protein
MLRSQASSPIFHAFINPLIIFIDQKAAIPMAFRAKTGAERAQESANKSGSSNSMIHRLVACSMFAGPGMFQQGDHRFDHREPDRLVPARVI